AMNDAFRKAIGHFVLVYLDDILVYSKTEEEHTQHLKWVLGKLREHKFYARLWKCHFYKRDLEYLGHLVGNDGLKVDPKKVVAVQNWPVPQDVGQIRSFLGLANYFRRFLENYSTVVAPLTALTRKGSAWEEVHSTKYGGHLGIKKTRWALSDEYWWPGLGTEVQQSVSRCDACARNKSDTKKPGGLLQPLEIPDEPWESVSLDFITDLPKIRDGHTAILVFVDRLTNMVHFVATTTDVSAERYAKLFVEHVFRLHGLPRVLVSDRDPRFTSRFWHKVTRTLGTKLKMSSAFHPQTDGQTERTNRTLEQMLLSFIGPTQNDWDDLLPVVEFAVNNSVHEGTHEKPFILNCGRHPTTPATHGIGGHEQFPAAKDFVGKQQEALKSARHWLQLSQQRQKSYADMKRREVSFEVGDKVLLSTKNIRLKIPGARKLFPRWIGRSR
ncbi:hypothetical protein CLOP_g20993, partial [Closterium sp. NIES-67]